MYRPPVLERGVFGIVAARVILEPGNPRIVDDHVGCGDEVGERLPAILVAHVQGDEGASDGPRRRAARGFVAVGQDDFRSLGMECFADGAADTARCAGDDAGFSGKSVQVAGSFTARGGPPSPTPASVISRYAALSMPRSPSLR